MPPTLQQATTDPHLHRRFLDTHRRVYWGSLPFSWVLGHKVLMCPPRVYSPVLCEFWQLYSGVNGDLLQEDLCHTHTQSPCPCSRPLSTCTSTGDAQTQFYLRLCGVCGSWCTQGLFEPPECLWQEQSLILNANLPFLPSCWGFSFAFGHGISPHSAPVSTILLSFFLRVSVWHWSSKLPRRDTLHPRSGVEPALRWSSHEEISHVQGQERWLHFSGLDTTNCGKFFKRWEYQTT